MILFKLLLFNLGGSEIFIILLVVLLFFGAKRIPELAKGLGKGMREFKDAMSGIENEVKNAANDTPPPPKPPREITEKIPDTFRNAEGTTEREKSE
jgi:sec-independent protein translocase protein TatA